MSTSRSAIGLLGIGEMGGNVGRELRKSGHDVRFVARGRGAESLTRAREGGLREVSDLATLVSECDILLSILPPSAAEREARAVADCLKAKPKRLVYVDANAISPDLVLRVAAAFKGTPAVFIDGGIIGQPPTQGKRPRLYLSGPGREDLALLDGSAFELLLLGEGIGEASGLKMLYAAQTKGANALITAGLVAAERLGLLEPFVEELRNSQAALLSKAEANVSRLPADSARWIREMEEIRDTFAAAGLPGGFHQAAAEVMALMASSPFGSETRRTRDRSRSMEQTVRVLAAEVDRDIPSKDD